MAPEGDLPAASATEVSAIEQSDNAQSEPVVRALADQERLIPSEQLIDDSRQSESVSIQSTAHATIIEKADSSAAVGVVASGIDSDNDGEVSSERSAATATADRAVGGLLEPRITVTAIYEELPKRATDDETQPELANDYCTSSLDRTERPGALPGGGRHKDSTYELNVALTGS
jgi:hypothetical protein